MGYQIIARRSAGGHPMLVFDLENHLHLPLTVFAAEAVKAFEQQHGPGIRKRDRSVLCLAR